MSNPKMQMAIKCLEQAIKLMQEAAGDDNMSFVASLIVFDNDFNVTDDSLYWSVGHPDINLDNVEGLTEELKSEKAVNDVLEQINLN